MKNLLKSVILVCTMAATSFAAAASFTVGEAKNSVFKVQYVSSHKGMVHVTILNSKNEVVFEEKITTEGSFVRPYNFSNMPEGKYTIVMKDQDGEQREVVNYSTEKVKNYVYMAEVPNQKSKYWLNVVSSGEETIKVRIYTTEGSLLHEEAVQVNGAYSAIFNLTKVNQPVTFEVTDGNGKLHASKFN
jgi:hypothetical protein